MSDFGTATLDLTEKADLRLFFRKPVPKLTEFWNRLNNRVFNQVVHYLSDMFSGFFIHFGKGENGMKMKSIVPLFIMIVAVFWIIYGLINHGFWDPVKGPITGFLPILASIPLVPVSFVGFIRSFKEEDSKEPLESWTIMLAAAIAFALVFIVGMIISLMLFVFVWVKFYEKLSWKITIINLVIAFGMIYGIFGVWLQVPFPNCIILDAILS